MNITIRTRKTLNLLILLAISENRSKRKPFFIAPHWNPRQKRLPSCKGQCSYVEGGLVPRAILFSGITIGYCFQTIESIQNSLCMAHIEYLCCGAAPRVMLKAICLCSSDPASPGCREWQLHRPTQGFSQNIDVHIDFKQDLLSSTFKTRESKALHTHTLWTIGPYTQDLVKNCHTLQTGFRPFALHKQHFRVTLVV